MTDGDFQPIRKGLLQQRDISDLAGESRRYAISAVSHVNKNFIVWLTRPSAARIGTRSPRDGTTPDDF
jgi:hypothetical protein